MSTTTKIEWTEKTWNPTTGCDKVSPGCDNCYALTMAKRLKGMGSAKYQNDGDPRTSGPGFLATEHESELDAPLRWRKPVKVFVNSMSDLFHEQISDEFIARVWAVMAATPQHTYQVLTKRHGRMRSLLSKLRFEGMVDEASIHLGLGYRGGPWPLPNVWLGVSVEDQNWADIRIPALLDTPAAVRFLSCEPLLGPVNLDRWIWGNRCPEWRCEDSTWDHGCRLGKQLLHWVIVGGESGPGARPMGMAWAESLVGQCTAAGVPVHVKQLGSVWARANGADSKGGDWSRWPESLRIRRYPDVP